MPGEGRQSGAQEFSVVFPGMLQNSAGPWPHPGGPLETRYRKENPASRPGSAFLPVT